MNILIVTSGPFPFGMAGTNRILSYCKGFIENKVKVKVICLKPTERSEKGILNKISALILVSNLLVYIIYFFVITKLLSITYIQEKSEFPFVLRKRSLLGRFYAKLYTSYAYKAFDAILVMTKPLKKYFQNKIRRNSKLLLVPMTVEPERFQKCYHSSKQPNYIAYCGSPSGNKDGVPILIEAFSIISKKYKTIKLYIIGDTPGTNVLIEMKNLAKKFQIENEVIFTGTVSRDKIPEYLYNASILALARPKSLQSYGGFPTKLGEYLSTGNPVVVTKVGEIPDYLKDCENAFISDPDSVEAFAEKLDYVLSHPDLAKRTGQKGREIALKHFNYKAQAIKIINFINELNHS